jgi:Ca2+-binding RTX toxin-like protein
MIGITFGDEQGSNILLGGSGNDTLRGGSGNDIISAQGSDNVIYGGKGDDLLTGAEGNDTIYGEEGNDILIGRGGNNSLSGDAGNDTLTGGGITFVNREIFVTADTSGTDTMTGGEGADTFVLGGKSNSQPGSNAPPVIHYDTAGDNDYALITDFDTSQDIILLGGSKDNYRLGAPPSGLPTGTALYLGNELIAILQGSSDLTLSGSYFQGSIG